MLEDYSDVAVAVVVDIVALLVLVLVLVQDAYAYYTVARPSEQHSSKPEYSFHFLLLLLHLLLP